MFLLWYFPRAGMPPRDNIISKKWPDVLMYSMLIFMIRWMLSIQNFSHLRNMLWDPYKYSPDPSNAQGNVYPRLGVFAASADFLEARLQLTDASILTSRAWLASLPCLQVCSSQDSVITSTSNQQ